MLDRVGWGPSVRFAMVALLTSLPNHLAAQCPPSPVGVRLEVTIVPQAGEGGPEEMESIAGTANVARAQDARVVIYAHSGNQWWVQPLTAAPLTEIRADGRWQATTHLGLEYGVLLVHKAYSPEAKRSALPEVDGCVWTLVTVKGRLAQASHESEPARGVGRTLRFSGYDWTVKSGTAGPGPNNFSDREENVRVDSDGRLHLRITYRDGQWYSAEVVNQKSFGFGTYRFFINSSISEMDPNAVLGMFTWSDDPAFAHRELDVEISQWGKRDDKDAQFVVQPWDRIGHLIRFTMPPTPSSLHSFAWNSRAVVFESRAANGEMLHQHIFSDGIPQAGTENARINLWLMNGGAPMDGKPIEVVLDRFQFVAAHN